MSKPVPYYLERCPWCDYYIEVHARGMRGNDPGAGVEAAGLMQRHIRTHHHGRTWQDFLRITLAGGA